MVRRSLSPNSGRDRLGCGVNEAYIAWKGGELRFCPLPSSTQVFWNRILNDVSEAEAVIQVGATEDESCCDCLGDVEPWCHELHIIRDGETVWSGPVTEVIYEFDKVTIKALDALAWTDVRIAETDIGNGVTTKDWSEWARDVMTVAFADDNPNFYQYLSVTASGYVGVNLIPAFEASALEQLITLSQTGLDFTVVGRTIIIGPDDIPAAPIATLLDEMILGEVKLIKDGNEAATRWFVHFQDDAGIPAVSDDVDEQCYGVVERMRGSDEALYDVDVAHETANIYVNATKTVPRRIEIPDGSRISPEAPWKIMDMIPGTRVDVALTRLCVDATQSFRLVSMGVMQGEGDEEVTITLGPLQSAEGGL
jgi:hypothetical protein